MFTKSSMDWFESILSVDALGMLPSYELSDSFESIASSCSTAALEVIDKEINDYILSVPLEDTLFLIGSGPSLKKVDMSLLKGLNTLGMNRQYISYKEWGFYPKHYVCIDRRLVGSITSRDPKYMDYSDTIYPHMIENPECTTETYCFRGSEESIEGYFKDANCGPYHSWSQGPLDLSFVDSSGCRSVGEKIPFSGNCGAYSTLVSFLYGYKRVVLLGINGGYAGRERSTAAGEDLDHYHPQYFDVTKFKQGENQGPDDHTSGLFYWYLLSRFGKTEMDREAFMGWEDKYHLDIISCSPDSMISMGEGAEIPGSAPNTLGCFPYMDLQHYLELHDK